MLATPLIHPQFDPIAIHLGAERGVHWYGLMYLAAFALFLWLANRRIRQTQWAEAGWTRRDVDDLLFWGVLGVVLGGRLGYVLFYKPDFYFKHLLDIFKVWDGGMSFHGGLLGVIVAMMFFAHKRGRGFFEVADFVAPCVPTGLGAGRIGNFINGELWGRAASPDLPWAMVFPQAHDGGIARHPSQIYQFLGEGVILFIVMWLYARHPRKSGQVSGLFMIGYGIVRFVCEFFRAPDEFLPLKDQWLHLSQGQWLSLPMILVGVAIWLWASKRKED